MFTVRTPFILLAIAFLVLAVCTITQNNTTHAQQQGFQFNTNPFTSSASGITQVVAPIASRSVSTNVLGIQVGTTVGTGAVIQWVACTATGCPGGTVSITAAYTAVAGEFIASPLFVTTPGSGLFLQTVNGTPVTGWVTFNQ